MNPPAPTRQTAPPSGPARIEVLARVPWGPVDVLVGILGALVVVAALSLTVVVLLTVAGLDGATLDGNTADPMALIVAIVGQILIDLAMVGVGLAITRGKYRAGLGMWGMRRWQPFAPGQAAMTLVGCFAVLGLYTLVVSWLGIDALEPRSNVPERMFDHVAVLPFTLLLVVVVAPVTEELFFRGFIFNGLRGRLTVPGAAAVSGLLFAAVHVVDTEKVGLLVPFSGIGFLLALLLARTGSLWNSILVHFSFNVIGAAAALAQSNGAIPVAIVALGLLYVLISTAQRRRPSSVPEREGMA